MKILAEYDGKKCYIINASKDNWNDDFCTIVLGRGTILNVYARQVKVIDRDYIIDNAFLDED